MKVLYDHQIFSLQRYGGISRYFAELYREFTAGGDIDPVLSVRYSDNEYLKDLPGVSARPLLGNLGFRGKGTVQRLLNERRTMKNLNSDPELVFHPTFYFDYFQAARPGQKYVITVMDMMDELFPRENDPVQQNLIRAKASLCRNASAILTISESSKNDMVRLLGLPAERIKVTYLSGAETVNPAHRPAFDLPARYVLFVGNRSWYKNFAVFLEGMIPLLKEQPNLHVFCAGGGAFTAAELERFSAAGVADRILQRNVGEEDLYALYRGARLFVFPSRYEGFGIPVLEAFACSCPLVVSKVSSLPEVAGEAALYMDPDSPDSITEAVRKILGDDGVRNSLVAAGQVQRQRFSWKKCAEETAEVYRQVVRS
jgi:glycosyltransferase involved in cell wall biosynthesis